MSSLQAATPRRNQLPLALVEHFTRHADAGNNAFALVALKRGSRNATSLLSDLLGRGLDPEGARKRGE